VFEDIILFIWQNNKINANINKKKGDQPWGNRGSMVGGKKRPIILGQKNINRWGKSKSGSFYTPNPEKESFYPR